MSKLARFLEELLNLGWLVGISWIDLPVGGRPVVVPWVESSVNVEHARDRGSRSERGTLKPA